MGTANEIRFIISSVRPRDVVDRKEQQNWRICRASSQNNNPVNGYVAGVEKFRDIRSV